MTDYDYRRSHKADSSNKQAGNQDRPSPAPQIWSLCPYCYEKVTAIGYKLIPTHAPERMGRCSLHPFATVCLVQNYINHGKEQRR